MVSLRISFAVVAFALTSQVSAHACIWHPSMWGFNLSAQAWPNGKPIDRPQDPIYNRTFDGWWFHGHLGYPPHPDDILQLTPGEPTVFELACDKGNTNYWQSNPGGDSRDPQNLDLNWPCVNNPPAQFHTVNESTLGGCALSIAYKSDINEVQPEDLTIFSVQEICVWTRFTPFEIPAEMPPCPNGKCICAWHWIHQAISGSEQMYMVGFQCNPQNATGTRPLARPRVPNRCGHDPLNPELNLTACVPGAKQPLFWLQAERNNMFNEYHDPPLYQPWYGFETGAQTDIFESDPISTPTGAPTGTPSPSQYHHTSDGSCGAPHTYAPYPSSI
ncbi:hypothetical protein BC827DRAFT_1268677 [Russula dissimulans]|nr:hypothetical protein BC827DRAFT_1268677 [Russula dissimulans]